MQLPKISLASKEAINAETKFYKGKAGVRKIYEDILKGKEQRSFVDVTSIEISPGKLYIIYDVVEKNPHLKMFEIYHNTASTHKYIDLVKDTKTIFINFTSDTKLSAQDILIYDNKVAIISFNKEINAVVFAKYRFVQYV